MRLIRTYNQEPDPRKKEGAMNTSALPSFARRVFCLSLFFFALRAPRLVHAQLVSDGQTNFLDDITTNVAGGVTVGTNGSFTLLVVINASTVTNAGGNVIIGANTSARSNLLVVTGAGSVWSSGNSFAIGGSGAFNQINALNGARVIGGQALLGLQVNSSNNTVLVSDPGTFWQATSVQLGYAGAGACNNQLIVSNGATLSAGSCSIGSTSGSNSAVIVTGANSVLTNSGALSVGGGSYGPHCVLLVTNGGQVFSGDNSGISGVSAAVITGAGSTWNSGYFPLGYNDGGLDTLTINNGGAFIGSSMLDVGAYDISNLVTVADAGSSLQCQAFRIGYASVGGSSIANQCVVSNGALLSVGLSNQPAIIEGTFTRATITGPATLWTNAVDLDFGQYSNVLSVTGGGTLVNSNGYFESGFGKPNLAIVAGANSLWKNVGDFHMTDSGGELLITNGGTLMDRNGYFGDNSSGFDNTNSFALVAGAGSVWSNHASFVIGENGYSNQVLVTDGGTLIAAAMTLGQFGNGNQLTVSNSAFVGTTALSIGNFSSQSNTLTLAGGTVALTNAGNGVLISDGTLVLNSGVFMDNFLHVISPGIVIFNGGTLQSADTSYANTAPFVVGDGTDPAVFRFFNGGQSFSGGLVVSSNGVLTGVGTITGNVSVNSGGTLAPGTNSNLATITIFNSGVMLNPGSTTSMRLNASTSASDVLTGMSNIVYGGTLKLTNTALVSLHNGNSFKLFVTTNYSGGFSGLVPATPGAGLRWDTGELKIDGTLRVFTSPTAQPQILVLTEPDGSLVLTVHGIPYDPCYLLTSTNLDTPLADWSYVATNYFDSGGNTGFTNSIAPGQPQQFYNVQVN